MTTLNNIDLYVKFVKKIAADITAKVKTSKNVTLLG